MSDDERVINGITFFSTKAASAKLGISAAQVAKRCREGKLVAQKVGSSWFVRLPNSTSVQQSVPKKIASTVVSALPTKPMAQLPVAYMKSIPMIIGVVTVFALFFVGTLPFSSQSIASSVDVHRPFVRAGSTVSHAYMHVMKKTDELLGVTSQTAAVGVLALRDDLVEMTHVPVAQRTHEAGKMSRPSALARTLTSGKRTEVLRPATEQVLQLSSAAAALYGLELLEKTQVPLHKNTNWSCLLGFSDCPQN